MKAFICMSATVRAACQHASPFALKCGLSFCSSVGKRTDLELGTNIVTAQQSCVTSVRCLQTTRDREVKLTSEVLVPVLQKIGIEQSVYQTARRILPNMVPRAAPHLFPYIPYAKSRSNAAALVNIQSLFEEDVIELCSRLEDLPSSDRAEGLATLLGACVEFGLEANSPPVLRLMNECLELLSNRDIGVAQLCRLGEVVCALEGRQSPMVTEVLNCVCSAVEEYVVSPSEAVRVYSLLTRFYEPANQQQTQMLSALHTDTQRLVHRLKASQVSDILQSLLKLHQRKGVSLVMRQSHKASRVFKAFHDDEIIKILSALMILGQHDAELVAAMEKHLPERLDKCNPELIGTVMEYYLQMRCHSEPLFEAVAENFCSSQMFKKFERILSERFSQVEPRSLIDVLHACIHLERFPLNYVTKVFSPHFLQRLQGMRKVSSSDQEK